MIIHNNLIILYELIEESAIIIYQDNNLTMCYVKLREERNRL